MNTTNFTRWIGQFEGRTELYASLEENYRRYLLGVEDKKSAEFRTDYREFVKFFHPTHVLCSSTGEQR